MTLQELIDRIPSKILRKGQTYFDNGNILQLKKSHRGSWDAEVEGNYGDYEVKIELDDTNQVTSYYCDCPYDGDICKHIAAVALAINNRNSISIASNQQPKQKTWEQFIKKTSLKDLRNFLLDYGEKHPDFRYQITLAFSKPDSTQEADNIPYYQSMINNILEHHDERGYMDYRNSYKAMNDISQFQMKADEYYAAGNMNEAFCISAAIAMESNKALRYMNDSSGQFSNAIEEAFRVIRNILNNFIPAEQKEKIFRWLSEQVQDSTYQNYGIEGSLESLFFETAISLKHMDAAYQLIDTKMSQIEDQDSWTKDYDRHNYLSKKIELLQSEGRTTEAEQIIDDHLHLPEFRQIRVKQALSAHQTDQAEQLILSGIQIAQQKKIPYTIKQWKDQLLELYQQQKDSDKYNQLALELFGEHPSEIKYFRMYKQTSPKADWINRRTLLISKLKKKSPGAFSKISSDNLAQIYIEEQLIEELFNLVTSSNNIYAIIKYTPHLQSKYPAELLEYYKAGIEIEAEHTGRSAYKSLIELLKKMSQLQGGLPAAKALRDSLLNKYKNRPAMKEMFQKLNWD